MTEPRNGSAGYAKLMIARARGEVVALRPQIKSYFGTEGGEEPARPDLPETTSPAPHFARRPPDTPDRPYSQSSSTPAAQRTANAVEPSRQAERRQAPLVRPKADLPPSGKADPTLEQRPVTAAPSDEPAPRLKAGNKRQEPARAEPPGLAESTAPQPRTDIAGEIARALARLQLGSEASERLMPPQPSADKPASIPQAAPARDTRPSDEAPAPRLEEGPATETTETAPLHIHIGELVIAPDPPAPGPRRAPTATAKWAPALALEDYRSQRMRGER